MKLEGNRSVSQLRKNMWFYYMLLAIGAVQAGKSNIKISGTGTIVNGKTAININVQIDGPGGLGIGPQPGAGAGTTVPTQAPTTAKPISTGAGTTVPTQGTIPQGTTPPTGATTPGAGGAFTEEEKTGLAAHNEFRKVHEAPLMTLDRQMCDDAKAYAEKLARMGTLMHSPKGDREGQGENLSMGCSTNAAQSMEQAVSNWYNEVCKPGYDFSTGGFSGGTGHFTQVVWKGSNVLGIGRAESTKGSMKCAYIVGRYKPAGNTMGSFPENVKKGSFDPNYCNSIQKKERLLDVNGKNMNIETLFTQVDVPDIPGKDTASDRILLLKKKKSFVGSKHH